MKTQVFKSYSAFLERPDKSLNGVSDYFAKLHPDFEEDNRTNIGCWNCQKCRNSKDCYNSIDLRDCYNCCNCYDLRNCHDCHDKIGDLPVNKYTV